MTIATLEQFKDYIRELSSDLDPTLTLALEAASAEVRHYVGFDPTEEGPADPDIVIACCLLASIHADAGDPALNDYRKRAAHALLTPHRLNSGIG